MPLISSNPSSLSQLYHDCPEHRILSSYGRMIEIYFITKAMPIPLQVTVPHRETGHGQNYFRPLRWASRLTFWFCASNLRGTLSILPSMATPSSDLEPVWAIRYCYVLPCLKWAALQKSIFGYVIKRFRVNMAQRKARRNPRHVNGRAG